MTIKEWLNGEQDWSVEERNVTARQSWTNVACALRRLKKKAAVMALCGFELSCRGTSRNHNSAGD